MLSLNVSYDILDWLNIAGRVRIDNANNLYTQKYYATTEATISEGGKNGHYTEARTYDTQTYADIMVNVNKNWQDWSLVANLGASLNDIKTDELRYGGPIQENGLANVFNVFDLDDTKKRASKSGWHDQTRSIFGSLELGWKKMLYLTLTLPQRLGVPACRLILQILLLSVRRSLLDTYRTVGYGCAQLSESQGLSRFSRNAVPTVPDHPDLRIRRDFKDMEGQDSLSDR